MHHKFAILDDCVLLNGSFNYTRAATDGNQENVLITNNTTIVAAFKAQYQKMWEAATEVKR